MAIKNGDFPDADVLNATFSGIQKMTTTARDAILTWQRGDQIYNYDNDRIQWYDGVSWQTVEV